MKQFPAFIVALGLFSACENKIPVSENPSQPLTDVADCREIIINPDFNSYQKDNFDLQNTALDNGKLYLTISYGGGCGSPLYELVATPTFMESNPVQVGIMLSFTDNDPCRALVTKQLCFDLTPLGKLYEKSYQTGHGTIHLRINNWGSPIEYTF
jgi:hypothetical protein